MNDLYNRRIKPVRMVGTGVLPLALLALIQWGCVNGSDTESPEGSVENPESPPARSTTERVYQREITFVTLEQDSTLIVPWFFTARESDGLVHRTARGWLARGDSWDPFFTDSWATPAVLGAWRPVPRQGLGIVVGKDDVITELVYRAGARELELAFDATLTDWSNSRGESGRLVESRLLLSNRQVDGLTIDISRARRTDEPRPGDWFFLISGDSLQLFLEGPAPTSGSGGPPFTGGGREGFRNLRWSDIDVTWTETRNFEPARRGVPIAWSFSSSTAAFQGTLTTRTPYLEAGEGEGPIRPVDAIYHVAGTVELEGRSFPVHGVVRHIQP